MTCKKKGGSVSRLKKQTGGIPYGMTQSKGSSPYKRLPQGSTFGGKDIRNAGAAPQKNPTQPAYKKTVTPIPVAKKPMQYTKTVSRIKQTIKKK